MQTENTDSYNGWTNYETWLVNIWLTNDPGTYSAARWAAVDNADALREWVTEWVTESVPASSLTADLLGAALSEVDWHEIAESLLEE